MERLKYQQQYSEPMTDGGRALVLRLNFTVSLSFVVLTNSRIESCFFSFSFTLSVSHLIISLWKISKQHSPKCVF